MPLKHSTETFLVFLLGAVMVVAGIVIAVLPPLPGGSPAWGVAFILSLIYPLALYPLLKSSRADYSFRVLHFAPAIMLVLWLVFQILQPYTSALSGVQRFYGWGWTFPAVLIGFILLAVFCIQVLRQRSLRLWLLALLLVPFAVLALAGERRDWPTRLSAALQGKLSTVATTRPRFPIAVVTGSSSSTSLSASSRSAASSVSAMVKPVPPPSRSSVSSRSTSSVSSVVAIASSRSSSVSSYDRAAYRRRLGIRGASTSSSVSSTSSSSSSVSSRIVAVMSKSSSSSAVATTGSGASASSRGFFARLFASIFGSDETPSSSSSAASSVMSQKPASASSRSAVSSSVSSKPILTTKPNHLAQTGFGLGEAAVLFVAGYCGVLHNRARRKKA